uniref:Putative carbamoyltransferase n=1 Tax=viral metagenome TaxID=1070528 RepID=A0A6M3L233_9ZZZZ
MALIVNDRLVAMVEKERLTRLKYDRGFMPEMIDSVLELGGIKFFDIDCVAISLCSGGMDEPKLCRKDIWGITIRRNGHWYVNGPRQLDPWECEGGIEVTFDGIKKPAYQVQHHVEHVASSYYLSLFDKAIGLSYDGSGKPDNQTSYVCRCEGNKIYPEYCPNLTGALLYGNICKHTYGSWRDSGKLMGLSAYGEPTFFYPEMLKNPNIDTMMGSIYEYFPDPRTYQDLIKDDWKNNLIKNVATSTQTYFFEDVKRVLDGIIKKYGKVNLVTSGGGALNVIANRYIYDAVPLYIAPFPKDDGLAVGGAMYVLHHIFDVPRQTYTAAEVAFMGGPSQLISKAPPIKEIAKELANGKIVLWHQGRSEVGPRALTHRSILADPRTPEMKVRVSEKVKGREPYRPLAPIVTEEDCSKYFDIEPNPLTELMLVNARVKSKKIPAVTHVDGTARVQTINRDFNHAVWNILKEFKSLTGIPVLINTSLNIMGQAICETERDTLWTFENCPADICVINGEVYRK